MTKAWVNPTRWAFKTAKTKWIHFDASKQTVVCFVPFCYRFVDDGSVCCVWVVWVFRIYSIHTNGTFFLCCLNSFISILMQHSTIFNALCVPRNTCNFVFFINICYYIVIGCVFCLFVCASILAFYSIECITALKILNWRGNLNWIKMCYADVKINKGSSGFPTTFILFTTNHRTLFLFSYHSNDNWWCTQQKYSVAFSWKQIFVQWNGISLFNIINFLSRKRARVLPPP